MMPTPINATTAAFGISPETLRMIWQRNPERLRDILAMFKAPAALQNPMVARTIIANILSDLLGGGQQNK